MRVLIWNLFHGRAQPGAGRDLQADFAAALAAWDWDVAALQEVPPWWPQPLARACGASSRHVLTSRNALLPVRRALATRWPDVVKSNGGGANAILVRGHEIGGHRAVRLRAWPERRVAHAVRLGGLWIANLHAQVRPDQRARADIVRAAAALDGWADGGPAVLAGDFNTRAPRARGFELLGLHRIDGALGREVDAAPLEVLDAGALSDHAPVRLRLLSDG